MHKAVKMVNYMVFGVEFRICLQLELSCSKALLSVLSLVYCTSDGQVKRHSIVKESQNGPQQTVCADLDKVLDQAQGQIKCRRFPT